MKKILSVLMSICIVASILTSVCAVDYGEELKNAPQKSYEQKFSDVSTKHWAFGYIAEMVERGVLNGYPDGKFYPDSQVTRAEFAKIMTTAAGLSLKKPTSQIFADVAISEWYAPYVHTAKEYLSAYTQNGASYYLPNTPALREDIAVALVKLKGYSTTGADVTAVQRMFSDYRSISQNAQIYVATAIENGLISGYDDGTFRGQNGITRAEAATLLWRAYQYGNDNKTYDDIVSTDNTTPSKDNAPSDKKQNASDDNVKREDEEPVVEIEERKPYVMRKLASANLASSSLATVDDDNNIYYIDENDNCVYQIDISNGRKTKYLDTNQLSYRKTEKYESEEAKVVTKTVETGEYEEIEEEITETVVDEETGEETEVTKIVKKQVPITKEVTELEVKTIIEEAVIAEYNSFVPVQIFYDSIGDRLLLIGCYINVWEVYKGPQTDEDKAFIYDISNNKEEMYAQLDKDGYYFIQAVLNDEKIVLSGNWGGCYVLDVKNGSLDDIYMRFSNSWMQGSVHTQYLLCVSGMVYNHRLFGFNDGCICEYDFSQDKYNAISDYIDRRAAFGMKDDCYYFWDKEMIYKMSVKNGAVAVLDINTRNNNVEFEDGYNLKNIDYKFFVIDDNTIVFYDAEMKAFRILEKN